MFIWDFTAVFAVGAILMLTIVMSAWVIYTLNRSSPLVGFQVASNFRHCHYCGYVYFDYLKMHVNRCPQCLSYHD